MRVRHVSFSPSYCSVSASRALEYDMITVVDKSIHVLYILMEQAFCLHNIMTYIMHLHPVAILHICMLTNKHTHTHTLSLSLTVFSAGRFSPDLSSGSPSLSPLSLSGSSDWSPSCSLIELCGNRHVTSVSSYRVAQSLREE